MTVTEWTHTSTHTQGKASHIGVNCLPKDGRFPCCSSTQHLNGQYIIREIDCQLAVWSSEIGGWPLTVLLGLLLVPWSSHLTTHTRQEDMNRKVFTVRFTRTLTADGLSF